MPLSRVTPHLTAKRSPGGLFGAFVAHHFMADNIEKKTKQDEGLVPLRNRGVNRGVTRASEPDPPKKRGPKSDPPVVALALL